MELSDARVTVEADAAQTARAMDLMREQFCGDLQVALQAHSAQLRDHMDHLMERQRGLLLELTALQHAYSGSQRSEGSDFLALAQPERKPSALPREVCHNGSTRASDGDLAPAAAPEPPKEPDSHPSQSQPQPVGLGPQGERRPSAASSQGSAGSRATVQSDVDAEDLKMKEHALQKSLRKEVLAHQKTKSSSSTNGVPGIKPAVQIITNLLDSTEDQPGLMYRIATSTAFDAVFAVVIISNAFFIGFQVEWMSRAPAKMEPTAFKILQYIYCVFFTVELAVRFRAFGCRHFFCNPGDRAWNIADFIIVAISLVEAIFQAIPALSSNGVLANMSLLRIVRICRLLRALRVVRVMSSFRALRILIHSVFGTLRSLAWAMVLMCLILYTFGIMFTQATSDHFVLLWEDAQSTEDVEKLLAGQLSASDDLDDHMANGLVLVRHYGTLWRSIFTLFQAICGGVNWGEVVHPLSDLGWIYVLLFVVFIAFTYFAVMNVFTGVFCQNAIETAVQDTDEVIEEQLKNKKHYMQQLNTVFKDMDGCNTGTITLGEFEKHVHSDRAQAWFQMLGLDVSDAWTLFRLLDADGTNTIDSEEFVEGCLKLRGQASSIQIARMMQENKVMLRKVNNIMHSIEKSRPSKVGRSLSKQRTADSLALTLRSERAQRDEAVSFAETGLRTSRTATSRSASAEPLQDALQDQTHLRLPSFRGRPQPPQALPQPPTEVAPPFDEERKELEASARLLL